MWAVLKAEVEGENESQLAPVTVRVFGPNTEAVIDRDRELQVAMSFALCSFPCFVTFEGALTFVFNVLGV